MKLSPIEDALEMVEERNITYGAYVTVSYEIALTAVEAGTELDIPIIFITDTDCCDLMGGFKGTVDTVKKAVKAVDCKIPVAFHLDHCRIYEECVQAVQVGCSSVMTDGSSLPSEENVALTERMADYAYCYEITMEGELGKLVGEEGNFKMGGDPEPARTDLNQAKEFVERTGIDRIAANIGTQHGVHVAAPRLNIERFKKMHSVVGVPIVLHDGSEAPKGQVQEVIGNGIREINIAADVLIAVANSSEDTKQKLDFKYNTGMSVNSQACARELIKGRMGELALMD